MKLTINGADRDVDATTLAQLLDAELASTQGVAAAVDGEVVPRAEWGTFPLTDGQAVELLTAVQGG
ncbi:MAG TPA: sulfur carrier protein ThiS [Jatrophihabitantaceae bacterium]|jgi:sulfur carrier protein